MLNVNQLANEIGVHFNTINKWRKMGMPCFKIGKRVLFDLDEVKKWMKENSEE